MGVAIFIVTEREIEDLDTFVNGKAIAKIKDEAWAQLSKSAGIKSMYDYVSMNPEELSEFIEDAGEEPPDELPPEQWFEPAEGIAWTRTLTEYLKANPKAVKGVDALHEDLEEFAKVFSDLAQHSVRWHFQVDF